MNRQFQIGSDPEAFLVNQQGKYISAIGLIGGTKWDPRRMGDGYAIQEDNVAVEYNIPPSKTSDEFVKAINRGIEILTQEVSKYNLQLKFSPSAEFTEDQLAHPMAKVFGCDPDYNAWTGKQNRRPSAKNKALRSAGGHIHIQSEADPMLLGQWCDVYLGLPFVQVDTDERRRLLYGSAGAIRVKDYPGIEYRTLSNAWLTSDVLKTWVFNQARLANERASQGDKISKKLGVQIRKAINTSDINLSRELTTKIGIEVPLA